MASVLIVGSGLAGLIAAIRATDAGHSVTLVTKAALSESNTRYAQGGIAAALFPDDGVEAHLLDTIRAGAGLVDASSAGVLCTEGPDRVRDLIRFGVAFDQDDSGLTRGLEAAHSRSRVLHAGGDATGAAIASALASTLKRRMISNQGLRIREHVMLAELLVQGGRVVGAAVFPTNHVGTTRVEHLLADAVILATGGAGALYQHTTNPAGATGDGVAAAWRAGASVADLEFYQFHPTALAVPGSPLVSEAVRGEGAVLLDAQGDRFMRAIHPDAELAPRDVVARAIARRMAAQDGEPVLLDATGLGRDLLESRFPTITAACRAAGLDWAVEPIPVAPAAHYWMGGIVTDSWGRSTLAGLFAIGETARTGAHGANRLASNSLLEAAVFADRAVRALGSEHSTARALGSEHSAARGANPFDGEFAPNAPNPARILASAANSPSNGSGASREALQRLMWREAGVLRSGDGLAAASAALAGAERPASPAGGSPGERMRAQEDANLLDLARLTVKAALAREESRGAHHRADFPHARAELARAQAWTRSASTSTPVDSLTWPTAPAATAPIAPGAAPGAAAEPYPMAEEALAC